MKFAFFGTDQFAVAILEKLINDYYQPQIVITQPDKPVGRKQVITPPPVKQVCLDHNIKVEQPSSSEGIFDALKNEDLDLIIVASYGKIIPQAVLDLPKHSAINVHTSLLPKYRGASPIQAVILNGEDSTGITLMQMDEELDHGSVIYQKSIDISPTDTYRSLYVKLAQTGSDVIAKILPDYYSGSIKPQEQDHDQATFTNVITKEDAKIDWTKSVNDVERSVRAFYDRPIAWTILPDGKRLKILKAHTHNTDSLGSPGQISITKNNAAINCADGLLELDLVQVEGGNKPIVEEEFIRDTRDTIKRSANKL